MTDRKQQGKKTGTLASWRDLIPERERGESVDHSVLRCHINRGTVTLPIGTSVSDLSNLQCAEILSLLEPRIGLPNMAEMSDRCLEIFDPFYSISEPVRYLLTLSQELQSEASSLEEYRMDYTNDLIEMCKEESSDKRSIYEETAHFIHEDICNFLHQPRFLLSAIYLHRDMISSVPEATSLVLQALAVMQLVIDRAEDALFQFADTLEYFLYKVSVDKAGKWHTTIVSNESRKVEELELELYEMAFGEIKKFTKWVEENKIAYRLEELAARLKVFCQIRAENPEELARMEANIKDERVATLLDKEIVKDIIKVLGKERKKRVQIVKETQYEDGGYMGSTLCELKRVGILGHTLPYYWVNPAYYKRLSICPDKDGQ